LEILSCRMAFVAGGITGPSPSVDAIWKAPSVLIAA
jgi:hypothetical protein